MSVKTEIGPGSLIVGTAHDVQRNSLNALPSTRSLRFESWYNVLRHLARASVALVWFYQGYWCKILADPNAPHLAVVASVPYLTSTAVWALRAIGCMEVGIGIWVLSGIFARTCAATQTIFLFCMNAGGLLWARAFVADPAGMVLQNFAFLVLAWIVASWEVRQ